MHILFFTKRWGAPFFLYNEMGSTYYIKRDASVVLAKGGMHLLLFRKGGVQLLFFAKRVESGARYKGTGDAPSVLYKGSGDAPSVLFKGRGDAPSLGGARVLSIM